jgi:hypothetical protein
MGFPTNGGALCERRLSTTPERRTAGLAPRLRGRRRDIAAGAHRQSIELERETHRSLVTTKPEEARNESTIVPVVGGSSDIGAGGGFFVGLTRKEKGYDRLTWHLEAAGFVSFGVQDGFFAPAERT